MAKGRRPYAQGALDGLCGCYAIVNAVAALRGEALTEAQAELLFKRLVQAIADKFPAAIWDGTGVPDIRRMIDAADRHARRTYGFGVTRREPFRATKFRGVARYYAGLAAELDDGPRVAVVGLAEPWGHWTLVTQATRDTLVFTDSIDLKHARLADAALSKRGEKPFQIDQHQTFVLERVER